MQCGAEFSKASKKSKFCSEACRNAHRREERKPFQYPSRNEREIEEIDAMVMQPGSRYSSYGQYEAARRAKAEGKIHAPKGFTSFEERKAAKPCD